MKKFISILSYGVLSAMFLGGVTCSAAEIKGDVDMNGAIEANDASFALQYSLTGPLTGFSDAQVWAADVDGVDGVNANDSALILQKALISTFEFPSEPEAVLPTDGVIVTDFGQLLEAVDKGERKIYIKGEIMYNGQLTLNTQDAGVEFCGLKNADGTAASINFIQRRDSLTKSGESGTGIYIKGSGYTFKDLIIENAGDCGVRIKGNSAGNCTFENCMFRYNNNSGVSITSGGHDNTFICCDSYRNGDIVQKSGADADGYSIKLSAGGGNSFYNCRAWENADDGWDSYDRGAIVPDVSYEECLAWHNGNPETFTGEYDYANNMPLDKNLVYVQAILAADPDFEAKYNAHSVDVWPNVTMKLLGTTNTYNGLYAGWGGNPNGFKFGSSDSTPEGYRFIKNCIAFDHYGNNTKEVQYRAKGFDQNCDSGSGGIHFDMENILSFNNVENIQMVKMNADSIKGVVWSFENHADPKGTMYPDEPSNGMTITEPANKDELKAKVYAYRDMIYSYVYNDKIPGKQLCDVFAE